MEASDDVITDMFRGLAAQRSMPRPHPSSCPGGCHFLVDTDALKCRSCGVCRPLVPGQVATGRREHEAEKLEFAADARRERLEALNGPMTRVIHEQPFSICRVCIVRSAEIASHNCMVAAPFLAILQVVKDKFAGEVEPFLQRVGTRLDVHIKMCSQNRYGGKKGLNADGRDAVRELQNAAEPRRIEEHVPQQPVADTSTTATGETTADYPESLAVDVSGLGEFEEEDEDTRPESPRADSMLVRVVSEGRVVDSFKKSCRDALQTVSTQTALKKALEGLKEKCAQFRKRNASAGKNTETFARRNGETHWKMVKRVRRANQKLNQGLETRIAKHVQTVAESMLENIVYEKGFEYANILVGALASKTMKPEGVAAVLSEHVTGRDHVTGRKLASGSVRKGKLVYNHRMCCDHEECMQKMCIGRSKRFEVSTGDKEGNWRVQIPMLGALAVCMGAVSDEDATARRNAVKLAMAASKELFLKSSFFDTRQSQFIATSTALMALHARTIIKDARAQQELKHDLSVHAIAVSMGFWPVYFGPCIETFSEMSGQIAPVEALTEFAMKTDERRRAFENEKGNASIDAALLYRRALYMYFLSHAADKAKFAMAVQRGGGAFTPVPNLPEDVFKEDVDLRTFAGKFSACMQYAGNAHRANSSSDSQLVRRSEKSPLSYDGLLSCVRKNRLGVGAYYEAEAGQRDLNFEQFGDIDKPNREVDRITDTVPRAVDICTDKVLFLVNSAASRIEITLPNFWKNTWSAIPQLKSFPESQTIHELGYHPAGALLKRLDDSHYVYNEGASHASQAPRTTQAQHAVRPSPLASPSVSSSSKQLYDRTLSSVQELHDVEAGLSVLMHGEVKGTTAFVGSKIPGSKKAKLDINTVAASILQTKSLQTADEPLRDLLDVKFLSSVVKFCDSAAKRAMDGAIQNRAPSPDPDNCPVVQSAASLFDDDAYVARACRLHVERLSRLVALKTANGDHMDSFEAQEDVYMDGELGTACYSKNKRTVLTDNVAALASAVRNGYGLVASLVGTDWIDDDTFDVAKVLSTERLFADRVDVDAVLKAVFYFSRSRDNLVKKVASYSESTGSSNTKVGGFSDSCSLLVPLAHWFDDSPSCHWHAMDGCLRLIKNETERLEKKSYLSSLRVKAIDTPSTRGDGGLELNKKAENPALVAICEGEVRRLKKEWDSAVASHTDKKPTAQQDARRRAEAVATSFSCTGVSGFDVYRMRGAISFVVGARPEAPQNLFFSVYSSFLDQENKGVVGYKPGAELSDRKKDDCRAVLRSVAQAMILLNTSRTTLADVSSFYRHRVVVRFLCEAAMRYGTNREQRFAECILKSGVCFLRRALGYYPKTLLGTHHADVERDDAPEDGEAVAARSDRLHLERLAQMKAESEAKRVAEEEAIANAASSARERGLAVPRDIRMRELKHRMAHGRS